MFNEVHLEGIVLRRWRAGNTHFIRLAVYSDVTRGARRDENYGRNLPDYAILRCEGVYGLVAANLPERARVSVSGRLISHQREMSLARFLQWAKGNEQTLKVLRSQVQNNGAISISYMVNEVLVERIDLVPTVTRDGSRNGQQTDQTQTQQTAITAPAPAPSLSEMDDAPMESSDSNTLEPAAAGPIA